MRRQSWQPDTHPRILFIQEWDEGVAPYCVGATVDGEERADFAELYALVLAENRMKNAAEGVILDALPASMVKPILDTDGDETGSYTFKDKHRPVWEFGEADGVVTFTVPGASPEVLTALELAVLPFGGSVKISRG